MSLQITTAFVEQYKSNVDILLQQKGSRLRNTCMVETGIVGRNAYTDQVGATSAVDVTSRHADSPLVSTPHLRRRLSLVDSDWGDLIDNLDKVRMLTNPQSTYAINAAYAMGRRQDDHIITAATGTANTGVSGGTPTAFPAAQQVAVDFVEAGTATDSNLTIPKLREAKRLLDAQEVEDDDRFLVHSASGLNSLLRTTEVTSADFNEVRALVSGTISRFMGFTFIRTQRGGINSNNVRSTLAYHRSGIKLGIGQDMVTEIQRRADKRFSVYVFVSMAMGAVRLEEEKVVEILSDEDQ